MDRRNFRTGLSALVFFMNLFIDWYDIAYRFLVRINPEDGKKFSARQGESKKTGRVVQRKVMAINPHVNSFIWSLTEFDWKTEGQW